MKDIKAEWLAEFGSSDLRFVLGQYRFLVHRFTQWLALVIGFAEHEEVRRLILPNLVDEAGGLDKQGPSHLTLLDGLLDACGVTVEARHAPTQETRSVEEWFFTLFSSGSTYESVCALGPGTESVSWHFLEPLQAAVKRCFDPPKSAMRYFCEHQPEVEDEHARSLDEALAFLEAQQPELVATRTRHINVALAAHQRFWDGCNAHIHRIQ